MRKVSSTSNTMTALNRAVLQGRVIRMAYIKADGTATRRVVEPYRIEATKSGDFIVKCLDRDSGSYRTYRIDRIEALKVLKVSRVHKRPVPKTGIPLWWDRGTVHAMHPSTGHLRMGSWGWQTDPTPVPLVLINA